MDEGTQEKLPSVFQLLKPAWELLRNNTTVILGVIATPLLVSILLFIILLVISGAVTAGGGTLSGGTVNAFGVLLAAIYIALTVTGVVVNIALMIVTLKAARGEQLSFTETFRAAWPYFFRVLGLYAIVSVAVVVGLALFIVPGLILLRRYFLAGYYVVDRNMDIFPAMDASADESKKVGGVWGLIGFALVIVFVGFIPRVGWVPALIASILYTCMITWRYVQITSRATPQPELEPVAIPKLGEAGSSNAKQAITSTEPTETTDNAGAPKKNHAAKHKAKKTGTRKAHPRR